jgi:hypothetical protein
LLGLAILRRGVGQAVVQLLEAMYKSAKSGTAKKVA